MATILEQRQLSADFADEAFFWKWVRMEKRGDFHAGPISASLMGLLQTRMDVHFPTPSTLLAPPIMSSFPNKLSDSLFAAHQPVIRRRKPSVTKLPGSGSRGGVVRVSLSVVACYRTWVLQHLTL